MSTSSRKLSFKVETYGSSSDNDTKMEELPAPYTDGSKEFIHCQFVERFRILAKKVFSIEESDYLDTTDLCTKNRILLGFAEAILPKYCNRKEEDKEGFHKLC